MVCDVWGGPFEGLRWVGRSLEGLGRVGGPFWKFGTGWETIAEVQDGSGDPP